MTADIRTDAPEATTRRLQMVGIPADVLPGLIAYVDALNAAQLELARTQYPHLLCGHYSGAGVDPTTAAVADLNEWFDVDPAATSAGKYVQVVNMSGDGVGDEPSSPAARSVHSVVVKATGQVCKSAGWKKGPAKSTAAATKGQPLSHWNLTSQVGLRDLVELLQRAPLNVYGGYLYTR